MFFRSYYALFDTVRLLKLLIDKVRNLRRLNHLHCEVELASASTVRNSRVHRRRSLLRRTTYLILDVFSLLVDLLDYESSLLSLTLEIENVERHLFLVLNILFLSLNPLFELILASLNPLCTFFPAVLKPIEVTLFKILMKLHCILTHSKNFMIVLALQNLVQFVCSKVMEWISFKN